MKKIWILLLAFLLTGCVQKDTVPVETTMPSTEVLQVTVTETTIPESGFLLEAVCLLRTKSISRELHRTGNARM